MISLIVITKYSILWSHYSQIKEKLIIGLQWPMILSFIVATFTFILTTNIGLWNLIFHNLVNGRTLIEYKHMPKNHQKFTVDPFNLGFFENWKILFGSNPFGWFLPIPTAHYRGNIDQITEDWQLKEPTNHRGKTLEHLLGISILCMSEEFKL